MKNRNTNLLTAILLVLILFSNAQVNYNKYGDGSLRLKSELKESWENNTLQWDMTDSIAYFYNSGGKVEEVRTFFSPNNSWVYTYQKTFTYTPAGNWLQIIDSNLLGSPGCSRNTYTYNANDQRTLLINDRVSNNAWVPQIRTQTNYTAFDSTNVELNEHYNSNVWTNATRALHTYNAQNRDTMLTYEMWNSGANQWRGDNRYIFALNANGQVATSTLQKYDTIGSSYVNYIQQSYSYDSANRLTVYTRRFWNSAISSWANSDKSTYSYNANGDIDQTLAETWDYTNLEWILASLTTYEYNTDNWQSGFLLQSRNGSLWVNAAQLHYTYNTQGYLTNERREQWNSNTLEWSNYAQNFYEYETNPLVNGIQDTKPVKLLVYPNPTNGPVTFINTDKNSAYEIYDMQGRLVKQGNLQSGTNSIILNEAKGTYIVKAGNATRQILKQ
jgi:hypothetical protein